MVMDNNFLRGSEWRKWDLHIHTPASFHWEGERFQGDPCSPENVPLVDGMIHALNASESSVFSIMDYWTFDGWFALKNRLRQDGAPKLEKTVFPGIELRLMAPMKGRLNAHVLFSDKISDQELRDFKSNLRLEFPGGESRNLSNYALMEYARSVPHDKLRHHGLDKEKTVDDDYALKAGSIMAELNCDSYKQAISKVQNDMAIGFMPFDTSDGLAGIERNEHYAYVLGLFKSSPIFETRNIDLHSAFSGVRTKRNEGWFVDFQAALNNIPRLAVSGSDAHRFYGVEGDNNNRGYGDYPSGKITWIKADPTFEGLQQAIKEPAKRSFIGECPPKIKVLNESKSYFIERLNVSKVDGAQFPDKWLDHTEILLNPDLVAVIGNKGSGKSALADITALLGNSKQSRHFSFLKENRFRGKTGEPAKYFSAQALWADGQVVEKNLNEDPRVENVELVKYIPQGHFEELCNAHVSGKSDAFEKELRTVIFSHVDDTVRLGSHDFDQLIEKQESSLVSRIDELRAELHKINRQIESVEKKMLPETRRTIEELFYQKERLLEEHDKIKPDEVLPPSEKLSGEQQKTSESLAEIAGDIEQKEVEKQERKLELTTLFEKKKACKNIQEGIESLKRYAHKVISDHQEDAELLGLDVSSIIQLKTNDEEVRRLAAEVDGKEAYSREEVQKIEALQEELVGKQSNLSEKLNAPQKAYQEYLDKMKYWEQKRSEIIGEAGQPDTLKGLAYQKEQFDLLPEKRNGLQKERLEKTGQIFDLLSEQRSNRESLFNPVENLIKENKIIRDEYRLRFKAELSTTVEMISEKLFSIVKQASGEFRGESESLAVIKSLLDKADLNDRQSVLEFVTNLHDKMERSSSGQVGILSMLRKGRSENEVYDFIFGLEYISPRYTLMFQDAYIGQLSPGQRGALLLIFYLLVDNGNSPIILDQPEENLDNETVVSLLVPVLNEAKKSRQILMVTHNPNLAVVCDAEQIIHCEFDRSDSYGINYSSGSIESKKMNKRVVDVLEGTMPAFDNRKMKYH